MYVSVPLFLPDIFFTLLEPSTGKHKCPTLMLNLIVGDSIRVPSLCNIIESRFKHNENVEALQSWNIFHELIKQSLAIKNFYGAEKL